MNVIAHNLSAMNAQRQFGLVTNRRSKATEKLSSGFRINRAADDAAGLSISEKMRRQIRGLTQGVQNTEEGISLCQVADGALAEVNEMLHRVTELSVKAATGTQSDQDRQYIQQEISQILEEIDRIGSNTTFNEKHIFRGKEDLIYNPDGTVSTMQDITFQYLQLVDTAAGRVPLVQGENFDKLHLQAITQNQNIALDGYTFNMIYGSGSTSNSSIRITAADGTKRAVRLDGGDLSDNESITVSAVTNTGDSWSRTATYKGENGEEIAITQTVKLLAPTESEKNYQISYSLAVNNDAVDATKSIQNLEFAFHTDTAYNNDDQCEGYFIDGNRVDKYTMYSTTSSPVTENKTNANLHMGTIPDSFSIVDVDKALTFSEKISFDFQGATPPDTLSIGHYNSVDEWSHFDNLGGNLGTNAIRKDLGFTLYYDMGSLSDLQTDHTITFNYGIADVKKDPNLAGVTLTPNTDYMANHEETLSIWIHTGVEAGDGMFVDIEEMNTRVLRLRGLDVSTVDGANDANEAVKEALKHISSNRAIIGAQQNRLEHIVANEENIIENTTAAESKIRDTDMAKLMVDYSNLGILEQAGQAMMAQANQSNAGILKLLQ